MVLDFVVELCSVLRGHLHLPRPFAREMEAVKPRVLWLRVYGCSHGAMLVNMEYPKRCSMLLGHGWKAFCRAHSLEDGHVLRFKVAEDDMLSVKFYGCSGHAGRATERIFGGDVTLPEEKTFLLECVMGLQDLLAHPRRLCITPQRCVHQSKGVTNSSPQRVHDMYSEQGSPLSIYRGVRGNKFLASLLNHVRMSACVLGLARMSCSKDSQNNFSDSNAEMDSGTSPERIPSDPRTPSSHGFPNASTKSRRKTNSDEEDVHFILEDSAPQK
ncbi:l-ascorbate oxidase-like protein [Hordeum vulgare]|nr:l-ascorbate oxidase-like protein [Hordeum vulgare]